MTKELRTTIEPSDIAAVELECATCHGRQVIQLGAWRSGSGKCPNCGEAWPQNHSLAFQNLVNLAGAIAEAKKMKDAKGLPFSVRFELVADPKDKL
jgi:hypothetical protein